ncbi:type IV toxin-antitoxin system AbiEi family antitoxin domain-containing protein [Rhodococcoides kroppenstedtii]|uniref:type IV toxin-antitoxin system AbiEi family antitoxin domain-containing protein n=1 Tax=Rhodococcoides kroppenstedtii TaxID=293050 RepID=UPI00362FE705
MDPCLAIAARHDGVITRAQAMAAGLSSSALERRVVSGRWTRLGRGIYMPAGQPRTDAMALRVTVHCAGTDAAATGPSAAWWFGLLDRPLPLTWVTVPRRRRCDSPGVVVRRRDLDACDLRVHRGLRLTTLPLTVVETATILETRRAGDGTTFLDRQLQTRVTLPMVQDAHDRNRGRTGAPTAEWMLRQAASGGESEAERIFLRELRRSGLRGWATAVGACGYVLDVAFPRHRVAIEIDGWAYHRTPQRAAHDAVRQNALVNDGWTVLRFTYHRLVAEPDRVIAEVRRALDR